MMNYYDTIDDLKKALNDYLNNGYRIIAEIENITYCLVKDNDIDKTYLLLK